MLIHTEESCFPAAGVSWLVRKPHMLVITALANKMAHTVWTLLAHNEVYQAPAVTAE